MSFTSETPVKTILADHPLLEKFQATLKEHLNRINEQLVKENLEIDNQIQILNDEREEIGSNLYDLQQKIDRQNNELDSYNSCISQTFEKRIKCEEDTRQSKMELKLLQNFHRDAKRVYADRMVELKKLQTLEQTIDKWQKEMEHNLKVSKLMLSKDKQEKERISKEKREMDFLLLNIEIEVMKCETRSDEILKELQENERLVEMLKAKLIGSNADLDALQTDNRRLISSWNDVIHAISNRDKLLARTNEDLTKENERIKVIQNEIDATKKEAMKQMEQNESLEQFKQRLSDDSIHLDKQYDKAMRELSDLNKKIEKFTILIEETDKSLHQASVENHILDGNLKSLIREHERQVNNRTAQENHILELLQEQVTTDQASKKRGRHIRDLQNKRRNMELMMNNTEAQLSEILFEMEKLKGVSARSRDYTDDLMKEQMVFEQKAKNYDQDLQIIKRAIEEKLKLHDRLNKQLAKLIEAADGSENDPLQRKIKDFETTIVELEVEIETDQNKWLRLQCNIVSMSEKLTDLLNESHLARQQLLVIDQKMLKVDAELIDIEKTDQNLIRDIKNLNTKLDILSAKLYDKKQNNASEKDQCQFVHMKLVDKLRSDEMSVIQFENELHLLANEIDELKRNVLDRHHEALSWETKWKMIEEAKRQNDEEYAKSGEIGAMKMEIRRMEVRLGELKRAQEKLVADMELCVHHREHIFDQANMRNKLPHKKSKLIDTMQYRFNQLQAKLMQITSELKEIDKQTANVVIARTIIEEKLDKLNEDIDEERAQYILLQNEIEQAILLKQENLELIVRLQNRAKRYRGIVQAQQIPRNRAENVVDLQYDRNRDISINLISILEDLLHEFPEHKFSIQRIRQTLRD
ncbi:coiled-coil domain-containing protein 40 [Contarinia nasturtii]|uniref:coiled-coil domain-containing protein 40 n=1 Tax=Contarinia nasturtii TaxID=265458 RepID=UPI0012D3E146|nr:coiled-coil domain-containing protein 40 [Contarinia nasturtii]